MALTVTNEDRTVFGDKIVVSATVTFDSSYPTGGEALASTDFSGLISIDYVVVNAITNIVTKQVHWDRDNSKLIIWIEDGTSGISAQAANTSDQSAVEVELLVFGK